MFKVKGLKSKILLLLNLVMVIYFSVFLLVSLVLTNSINKTQDYSNRLKNQLGFIHEIESSISKIRYWNSDVQMTWDPLAAEKSKQALEDFEKSIKKIEDMYPDQSKILSQTIQSTGELTINAITASSENKKDEALKLIEQIRKNNQKIDDALSEIITNVSDSSTVQFKSISDEASKAFYFGILMGIITCTFVLFFTLYLLKGITGPVLMGIDNLSSAARSLDHTSEDLNQISKKGSEKIENQAAAVEETVASMSQMQTMINATIDRIKTSKDIAMDVSSKASKGQKIVNDMTHSMQKIQEKNTQLSEIKKIFAEIIEKAKFINKIVDRLQLLSFNASIEAARAGENGKGFSVVAAEVGKLATVSGESAETIQSLLSNSKESVEKLVSETDSRVSQASAVTEQVNVVFKEVTSSVQAINEHFASIVSAAQEQKIGVEQVQKAMEQISVINTENFKIAKQNSEIAKKTRDGALALMQLEEELFYVIVGDKIASNKIKFSEESVDDANKDRKILSKVPDNIKNGLNQLMNTIKSSHNQDKDKKK